MSQIPREWLTPDEAASLLRITPRTLRELERRGKLRAAKISQRLKRYARADIEELLAASMGEGAK